SSVASLNFRAPSPANYKKHFSLFPSAFAATPCTVTVTCDDTNHTSTTIKDFSGGCDSGGGFTVEGKSYISWFNMGPNSCPAPNPHPLFINAVQGSGTRQIRSTDVIPATGDCDTPQASVDFAFDDGAQLEITQCGILDYLNFTPTGPGSNTVTETLSLATD